MIEVEHLSKVYGGRKAVDDISFKVEKGEILGFLGPNGAGKTTTMRILTCFMPATAGTARVAGFDVFEESLEVRRRIGYLPENPPLYPEMTVQSYLDFVARIKGTPSAKRKSQVDEVMGKCSIGDVRNRIVAKLSGRGVKDGAFRTAEDILQSHRDLGAIFGINDDSALGALAAVEKAGRQGRVVIVGFDAIPEARRAIADGKIFADVVQQPRLIGRQTIEAIAGYLAGEPVAAQLLIPCSLFTQEEARREAAGGAAR